MRRAYFVVIDTYILKQQLVSPFCYDIVWRNIQHFTLFSNIGEAKILLIWCSMILHIKSC